MSFTSRQRVWITGFVAVPVAALVLAACVPPPTPAPTASLQVDANATATTTTTAAREYWGPGEEVGDKTRVTTTTAPPAPTCNGATREIAIEQCHLTYRWYLVDTTSTAAQATASYIAQRITPTQCQNGTLSLYHSGQILNPGPTVLGKYPGAQYASENLYCMFYSNGSCPSISIGAVNALNGWLASPTHKANMDSIVSRWVNGGGACNPGGSFGSGTGVYVAVAHFHYP